MINKHDPSIRRILKFPAIRPCEAVSPATLLNSLIDVARKIIDYKSSFFASNKGNARQSIRLIGILLVFLEELRFRQLGLSDSVMLSLSELHFIFQKIQYLLEDCTRDGARLWMLMKSERVSGQFQVLIRLTATALDVLPLGSINVSAEVRESIELAMTQARKLRFEVDPDDESALKNVISILGQFENQIVPKPSDLRWVLNYLRIRSWIGCDREIKFLDNEIGLEYSTPEKRELGFLSSLMGFMTYSRAVSFADDDIAGRRSGSGRSGSNLVSGLNPDDFRCPISLEFMTEPVTIETGHTYDKPSILKWFRAGNATCPKTGEKLTSTELVPNLALKRLIVEYCSGNGIPVAESGGRNRDITRTAVPGSPAAEAAMKMVANFLVGKLAAGAEEDMKKAAYEVRLLTKSSIFNRFCLVDAGTIPHLLNMMLSSKEASAQENAIAALLNLSKHSKGKASIVENGGLEFILKVLKEGLKMEARQHAAGALFYLASVEEYRISIGENPEAIPSLIELLRDGTDRAKKNALVAIFGLLMHPDNHWRVLGAGLVPLLLTLLTSFEREDRITDSLAVLATLAEKSDGTTAILSTGSALSTIMGTLSSSTSRAGKEYCVSLLLALCVNGGAEVVQFLVKNSSLMGPLYSQLSEGTSRASNKARSLIRILHEFHERNSAGLVMARRALPPREQFVHVW